MANKSLVEDVDSTKIRNIIYSIKDEYELTLAKVKDLNILKGLYLETMGKDSLKELNKQTEKRIKQLGGTV